SPERAVDSALERNAIPTALPFVRKQAVEVLKASHPDADTAQREIAQRLHAFYAANPPPAGADVDQAVKTVQYLYARDVFPDMKVTFGVHPNNLGHTDSAGCFRCHDDNHKSSDGRVIKQDCEMCHAMQ